MKIQLRPWQQQTLEMVKALPEGSRTCIQAPTGAGKNILLQCIASYYQSQGKSVLLIVDRVELVKDLQQEASNFDLKYDIYTTQKVGRRKMSAGYDVYLVDEAHSKYPSVMKSILAEEKSILIGVTATAMGKGLGKIYGDYAYVPITFQDMVEDGTLVAPAFIVNENLIDTSKLRTTSLGEYNLGDLVLDRTILDNMNEVIEANLKEGQQCLILAPNQTEAINIKQRLDRDSAIYISGTKENFEEFKRFKVDIVITVYALSKGFNHPNIHLIIDCRPLKKSVTEFIQGVGRGTRRMDGKEYFKYIDMCGNYFRFQNDYNKWRISKRVKLNKKTKCCVNCDHDFLKTNLPAKCTQGEHLTYDEMHCVNSECFVDFIEEDMHTCPACKVDLITKCLKCKRNVNLCNRICPYCFSYDFKLRAKREKASLHVEYKEALLENFKTMSVDFKRVDEMDENTLAWMILKTSYYYAVIRKKRVTKTAPMYAHTLLKSFAALYPDWNDKTIGDVYRSFHKNYESISTGEYNYFLLERLRKELTNWWKQKGLTNE